MPRKLIPSLPGKDRNVLGWRVMNNANVQHFYYTTPGAKLAIASCGYTAFINTLSENSGGNTCFVCGVIQTAKDRNRKQEQNGGSMDTNE